MNYHLWSKKIFILLCVAFASFKPAILNAQEISTDTTANGLTVLWHNKVRLTGGKAFSSLQSTSLAIDFSVQHQNLLLLRIKGNVQFDYKSFAGVFFDSIPDYANGVAIWTYAPWNIWSKPVPVKNFADIKPDNVQFFYWQYQDGTYGAAVPLSDSEHGTTTIGSFNGQWGSKTSDNIKTEIRNVPAMAVGFGKEPFELFTRIYQYALTVTGHGENLRSKKKMPAPFEYIGWCTWNASNNGKDLSEENIIKGVKTFTDNKFPLGWVLVDDGWFRQKDGELQSFQPSPTKFPNGFKHLNSTLKNKYGVKYTGVWHTMNGLWNGIDSSSELGMAFKNGLFSWKEDSNDPNSKTHYFPKPGSTHLDRFWDEWYNYFKTQGFDFTKVDNQVASRQLAGRKYTVMNLAALLHMSLYKAVSKYFNGAVINCMDMTADAYLNFGNTAVARGVEDFFPYKPDETYDMQRGNAPAHVTQAIYNAIYFSQMVYSDFDMFQTNHPDAVYHALARVLNNGPIYLTDKPGEQNFEILNKMVFHDGKTVHSATALLPTEDCLFLVQQPQLFKAFSKVNDKGLLLTYNAADTDVVSGAYKASDINGFKTGRYFLYEYFSGKGRVANADDKFDTALRRKGYELVYVVPVKNNFAAFGLVNKYNAPATIIDETWNKNTVTIKLYEGGSFKAYSLKKPLTALLNGKNIELNYIDSFISIEIPSSRMPEIKLTF